MTKAIHAITNPSNAPNPESSKFSQTICFNSKLRLAPKALRTPISGRRRSIRAEIIPLKLSAGTKRSTMKTPIKDQITLFQSTPTLLYTRKVLRQ